MTSSLAELARVAAEGGDTGRAARLLAVVQGLRDAAGINAADEWGEEQRLLGSLREALGPEAFGAAWAAGQSLSGDQGIAELLSQQESRSGSGRMLLGGPATAASHAGET
jgi:hypothetical protein